MHIIPPLTRDEIKAKDLRNRERIDQAKRQLAERYVAHPTNFLKRKVALQ